ncbi:unnamed protein product [Trichobilharzia szidati]|nr:unnamed protein product [Trichobilharzia szidati]
MTDSNILKLVWEGKIPACFSLAQEDLAHEDHVPPPIYMFLPRVSYFPLVTEKVIKQFSQFTQISSTFKPSSEDASFESWGKTEHEAQFTPPSPLPPDQVTVSKQHPLVNEFWLEYAHQPLKWHYPIGLVFDMCADTIDIPWKITVHFSNYPTDLLLSPPVSRPAIEAHFLSMIKEADALKHRSYVINQMQARDHRQLWNGLLHFRYDQFWSVNSRLMEPLSTSNKELMVGEMPSSEESDEKLLGNPDISSTKHRTFRYIPCRLYCATGNSSCTSSSFIQKLIRPLNDDGSLTSLQDAIGILFQSHENSRIQNAKPENYLFFIHGITVPQETSMQWISEHMSYPDNFIHIVARPRSQSHRIQIHNLL